MIIFSKILNPISDVHESDLLKEHQTGAGNFLDGFICRFWILIEKNL